MSKKSKKKMRTIYSVLILLLLSVALFCAFQIIMHLVEDRRAEDLQESLIERFVRIDTEKDDSVQTLPEFDYTTDDSSDGVTVSVDGPSLPDESQTSDNPNTLPSLETITSETDELSHAPDETAATVTEKTPTTTKSTTTAENKDPDVVPLPTPSGGPGLKIDFEGLKGVNSEVVGWLYGQEGHINHPVMQGPDNDKYLRKLLNGKSAATGSFFFNCTNSLYDDDYMILYGHHMINGTMFGRLHEYQSKSYCREHPYFMYYTPDATYRLDVCMYLRTDTSEKYILKCSSAQDFEYMWNFYKKRATYVTDVNVEYGDKIIIFNTCRSADPDARINMFLKMTKVN